MSRIKIILADSNYVHMENLQQHWSDELDFDINRLVTTGSSLIKHIEQSKPDVVVMDLVLKELDGFAVLDRLQRVDPRPAIIVYSASIDDSILKRCAGYGVDYYIQKPAEPMHLAKRIRMLCHPDGETKPAMYQNNECAAELRIKVTQLLNTIGMPNKLRGYRYLRRALVHVLLDSKMLDDLASGLYVEIAKEEESTATNVERSIRYAIEFVFMYGCLDTLQDLFGFTVNSNKGKPSNREFIAMMSDHLSIS